MVKRLSDPNEIHINPTAPADTSVLWYDTDDTAPSGVEYNILQNVYPVGTIYSNKTNPANPATIFGFGTWIPVEGVVVAGYKAGDSLFGTAGATVGAKTHTLTVAEMPSHDHTTAWEVAFPNGTSSLGLNDLGGDRILVSDNFGAGQGHFYGNNRSVVNHEGGGAAHNIVQPTTVAYVWERTA